MCGLTGVFQSDAHAPVDRALLQRMNDAIAYRGPDGEGLYFEDGIGLGHRRLSIVDIEGGSQPMFNEDKSIVIVFNGEIYNFPELRPELQSLGHVFQSRCDTEAVIHAWESWGPDCLQRLAGMFAFALWDRRQGVLFLARDRLGKKPLYYGSTEQGALLFGSELAALTCVQNLSTQINPQAVDDFFTFGYIPDPNTIYTSIKKLPPATYVIARHGEAIVPTVYWTPPTCAAACDEAEAIGQVRPLLAVSTQRRLMSDVPLGAFLSGGVDSSAVVAVAAGLLDSPLATFTIGFPGTQNEAPLARLVAERYGTLQHEEDTVPDYIEAARRQAAIFGEPFGDSSAVPTEAVCALARKQVTVAISGDGGDEVFGGYRRYRFHQMAEAVRSIVPARVRRPVMKQLAKAYPKMDWAPRWLRAKNTLSELSLDSALGYFRTITKIHHVQRRSLFSTQVRSALGDYDPADRVVALMDRCDDRDSLLQAQFVDIGLYLPGDILQKVDRTSMAHSLEVRAPFLDHEFVEWGMRLPSALKLKGREGKWLLKRALEPLLPAEILYRTKQGFAMDLAAVFCDREADVRERLLSSAMADSGLFDLQYVGRVISEHLTGRVDHSTIIWLLLTFEGFLHQRASQQPPTF